MKNWEWKVTNKAIFAWLLIWVFAGLFFALLSTEDLPYRLQLAGRGLYIGVQPVLFVFFFGKKIEND